MSGARVERPAFARIATWTLSVAVLAAAVFRLDLAWTDLSVLLVKTVPDDAFYYFQIARHLAHGDGVSFDGLTATTGFHPLWLAAIAPLFYLFPGDPQLPVHLTLMLSTLLSLATAWFVYSVTRQLTGDRLAAAMALLLYAFNRWVALESLNGLETALGTFFFTITAWYYLAHTVWNDRRAVMLGMLAGLTVLARTDNMFLFLFILFTLRSGLGLRTWLRTALIAGLSAAVLVAPWVIWSAIRTGSPIQSSGLAVPFVLHGNIVPERGTDTLGWWITGQTLDGIRLALRYSGTPWPPLPFVLVILALAIARRRHDTALPEQLGRLNFIAVTLLVLVLFHSSYRLYPRGWYFVPVAVLSALYLGVLLAYARTALPGYMTNAVSAAAVLLIVATNTVQFGAAWRTGVYPWQSEMLAAARWLGENTGRSVRVGAFNAGIMAYWNPDHTVINLDGVVNRDAFAAIRQRQLWRYIDQAHVSYLLDYEPYWLASPAEFSNTYGPYLGVPLADHVSLVGRIPGTLHGSDIVIMKIQPAR